MPEYDDSNAVLVDIKDAILTVADGDSNSARLRIGDGDFTFKQGNEKEYKLDAGKLWRVKEGDEVPVEVTFDVTWLHEYSGDKSAEDILLGQNGAVSTDTNACNPYACDVNLDFTKICAGVTYYDNYLISDFRVEPQTFSLKDGMLKMDGKANITKVPHTQSSSSSSA